MVLDKRTSIIPDISFWQENTGTETKVNFERMKKWTDGVIIRAGQGSWIDREFKNYWKGAKEAGLLRGSYWYYDNNVDPKVQAEKWVDILGNDRGELPMWCDFEQAAYGKYKGWKHWYNFITVVQSLMPSATIGIYTGYYYWTDNTTIDIPKASLEWFGQFPLWIAAYKTKKPLIPKPWTEWTMWQYTDEGDGLKYGVESLEIDLNYCNIETFIRDLPIKIEGESTDNVKITFEKQEKQMYSMTPKFNGTKLRSGASISYPELSRHNTGSLVVGDTVTGNTTERWLHVTSIDGKSTDGWMAIVHGGQEICSNFKEIQAATEPSINYDVYVESSTKTITISATDKSGQKLDMSEWTVKVL